MVLSGVCNGVAIVLFDHLKYLDKRLFHRESKMEMSLKTFQVLSGAAVWWIRNYKRDFSDTNVYTHTHSFLQFYEQNSSKATKFFVLHILCMTENLIADSISCAHDDPKKLILFFFAWLQSIKSHMQSIYAIHINELT